MGRIKVIKDQNTFFECDKCGQEIFELDTECLDCGNSVEEISKTIRRETFSEKKEDNEKPQINNEDDFFSFEGRIRRKTYFSRMITLSIIPALISIFASTTSHHKIDLIFWVGISIGCGILVVIQAVKRLHDLNMSGWYILLSLVPAVNIIFGVYLLLKEGTPGENEFGEDPKKYERNLEREAALQQEKNVNDYDHVPSTNNDSDFSLFKDLEMLADLKEKGILTEQEFTSKKKQILNL